jgi:hypothetical protein
LDPVVVRTVPEPEWRSLERAHEQRVDGLTAEHLTRRADGRRHPVADFLFTYYSHRPAQLRRWHPGPGVALEGGEDRRDWRFYRLEGDRAVLDGEELLAARGGAVPFIRDLLARTASRPAQLGCFGLHEWAMVHRLDPSDVRHASWPLRLGPTGTDQVVESHRITCSHFDAFRFFTASARPLNTLQPGRDDRAGFEQPGCLHAGMDLYKHAFRLTPLVCSDLVADCFELARDIRVLDMRASPYDLTGLGYQPVRIETGPGKQEYVAAQRAFAERGAPLRQRLIAECDRLLSLAGRRRGRTGAPPGPA